MNVALRLGNYLGIVLMALLLAACRSGEGTSARLAYESGSADILAGGLPGATKKLAGKDAGAPSETAEVSGQARSNADLHLHRFEFKQPHMGTLFTLTLFALDETVAREAIVDPRTGLGLTERLPASIIARQSTDMDRQGQ